MKMYLCKWYPGRYAYGTAMALVNAKSKKRTIELLQSTMSNEKGEWEVVRSFELVKEPKKEDVVFVNAYIE